ncbi:hypothetical protein GCM10023311_17460 [Flaviramulus aquimarinus]|uniref:Uncharacterized protein n=1 Tax=Flaviramulus aquimarinus TaxID=1170456 RepID=A0ABP9F5Y0_9FLAO
MSIDIFDKSNPSYCIKNIREIGYPKADTTYNFKNDWANEYRYNSVRLGIKSKNIISLYKLPNFTRPWAEKALLSKIQKGSPLYLAGFRNKTKSLFKIYFYSNLTFSRNILAKYYTFLISNLSAK